MKNSIGRRVILLTCLAAVSAAASAALRLDQLLVPKDDVMAYVWAYAENVSASPLEVTLAVASDDSIQVLVNGSEVLIVSEARGSGPPGNVQNRVLLTLQPGVNTLTFKVFQGGGGWNMRARFEDAQTSEPLLSGGGVLNIGITPYGGAGIEGTDSIGFFSRYLVLGPFDNPWGPAPYSEVIRQDWLFDFCSVEEASVSPYDGMPIGYCSTVFEAMAEPEILLVAIDVKPGSDPNCFNINGHGVVPVAILGSPNFDVTDVDVYSLAFGGLDVRVRGNKGPLCSVDDVNLDGLHDLVCHFQDDPDYWESGEDDAVLSGSLLSGMRIEGADSICIVP